MTNSRQDRVEYVGFQRVDQFVNLERKKDQEMIEHLASGSSLFTRTTSIKVTRHQGVMFCMSKRHETLG